MKKNLENQHTFAIMAYKDAPYIEGTIRSILNQSSKSRFYIATSTLTSGVERVADEFSIPIHINANRTGIVGDWEFALSCAKTPFVTLVDQDDIYHPDYASSVVECMTKYNDVLITFTNYTEIDGYGKDRKQNRTMNVKKILLFPLYIFGSLRSKSAKKMILIFGNPICSPSVTYNLTKMNHRGIFDKRYTMSLDWDAWLRMCSIEGRFVYSRRKLLKHRIHSHTQTSGGISMGLRGKEDREIFLRIWPDWFANILMKIYSKSYETNI